jgi:hypothetical protein
MPDKQVELCMNDALPLITSMGNVSLMLKLNVVMENSAAYGGCEVQQRAMEAHRYNIIMYPMLRLFE